MIDTIRHPSHPDDQPGENISISQSIEVTAQVTREMKLPAVFFVVHQSVVTAAPQTSVGTFSAFSNFNPQSQTFTAGSNSQLRQTFSSSQDYGFQSLDYGLNTLLGSQGLGGAGFNGLANTGLDINTGAFDAFSSAAGELQSRVTETYNWIFFNNVR